MLRGGFNWIFMGLVIDIVLEWKPTWITMLGDARLEGWINMVPVCWPWAVLGLGFRVQGTCARAHSRRTAGGCAHAQRARQPRRTHTHAGPGRRDFHDRVGPRDRWLLPLRRAPVVPSHAPIGQ